MKILKRYLNNPFYLLEENKPVNWFEVNEKDFIKDVAVNHPELEAKILISQGYTLFSKNNEAMYKLAS